MALQRGLASLVAISYEVSVATNGTQQAEQRRPPKVRAGDTPRLIVRFNGLDQIPAPLDKRLLKKYEFQVRRLSCDSVRRADLFASSQPSAASHVSCPI